MNLDERERAAYMAGDYATAELCVLAIDGDEHTQDELMGVSAALEHSEASADALAVQIAGAQSLLDAWPSDLLDAIRHYVATYLEDTPVERELLDLIDKMQDDLDERIDALRDALC